MNVLTEDVITNAEAKKLLEKRGKESELKYEQKNALENLKKFVKIDAKRIENLVKELNSIEKLRDKHIVLISNFLPQDNDDLRAILHKEYTSFSKEEIEKILEIVKKV